MPALLLLCDYPPLLMENLAGRALMEQRFGPLGCGQRSLAVNGRNYELRELLIQIGAEFDDAKPIDAQTIGNGHYVLRYFDAEGCQVVAYEFDSQFRRLDELRAHVAEWYGDQAYFSFYAGH